MSATLVRKEIREHLIAWLLLLILAGPVMCFLLLLQAESDPEGSLLVLLRHPAFGLGTFGALFMAHRLMVREYGQRTQLFLESLPLSRTRILTTKLVLGAACLLFPLALDLLLFWSQAREHEDVTARALFLLFLRAASVVVLGWTLFALAGLLGRYRNSLYLLLVLALFALDHFTQVDISRSGPFALLGPSFGFERHRLPWSSLLGCWSASVTLTGLCFGMVLYGDGTLTELLSQRMSHREKVFITCVFVGLATLLFTLDREKQRQPFALHEAQEAHVNQSALQVASGTGFPPEQAQHLAEQLAEHLGALADYLALERLPSVAVLPIRELDADVFQRATLEKTDGVVVRANLAATDFDPRAFEAFLFREVLIELSDDVVLREERQWLLDGFTTWWVHRDTHERLSAGAAVASREDFDPQRWLLTRERLGPCLSGALAARGIQVLRERLGEKPFQVLMRRTLAPPRHTGFWGLWREPRVAALLQEQKGPSEEELSRLWHEALRADRDAHPALLASLAGLHPALLLVAESEKTFRLEHTLRTTEGQPAPSRYALLYDKLRPFETEVATHDFSRQDAVVSPGGARLPQGLSRGDLWLFVMQVESQEVGCPVRLLAQRREIR